MRTGKWQRVAVRVAFVSAALVLGTLAIIVSVEAAGETSSLRLSEAAALLFVWGLLLVVTAVVMFGGAAGALSAKLRNLKLVWTIALAAGCVMVAAGGLLGAAIRFGWIGE